MASAEVSIKIISYTSLGEFPLSLQAKKSVERATTDYFSPLTFFSFKSFYQTGSNFPFHHPLMHQDGIWKRSENWGTGNQRCITRNEPFRKWKVGPVGSLQMRKGSLQETKINKPARLNNFLKEIKMENLWWCPLMAYFIQGLWCCSLKAYFVKCEQHIGSQCSIGSFHNYDGENQSTWSMLYIKHFITYSFPFSICSYICHLPLKSLVCS